MQAGRHPSFINILNKKMHAVSVSMTNYASMKLVLTASCLKILMLSQPAFFRCIINPSMLNRTFLSYCFHINLEWPIIHKKGLLVKISKLFQFLDTAFMKAKRAVKINLTLKAPRKKCI